MLIAHASRNLTEEDIGFVHASAMAAADGGKGAREVLTVHVRGVEAMGTVPRVKSLLRQWELDRPNIGQRFFGTVGYDDPPDGVISACRFAHPDLMVLPTAARHVQRLFSGSTAEAVACNIRAPSLLLPVDQRGFVDSQTGELHIERVLVLGGEGSNAQLGLDAAAWFLRATGQATADITLLNARSGRQAPHIKLPDDIRTCVREGDGQNPDVAASVCEEKDPQLVVMVSHGHDSVRDVLFANHSERVLQRVRRPLLWIPPSFRVPSK